jgi:hypothetical protein
LQCDRAKLTYYGAPIDEGVRKSVEAGERSLRFATEHAMEALDGAAMTVFEHHR